jgi:hypothetical protein
MDGSNERIGQFRYCHLSLYLQYMQNYVDNMWHRPVEWFNSWPHNIYKIFTDLKLGIPGDISIVQRFLHILMTNDDFQD